MLAEVDCTSSWDGLTPFVVLPQKGQWEPCFFWSHCPAVRSACLLAHLRPGPQWMVLEFDGAFTEATLDNFGASQSDLKVPAPPSLAAAAAAISDTLITYSELLGGIGSESDISSSINISSDISSASYLLLLIVLDCGISGAIINRNNHHWSCLQTLRTVLQTCYCIYVPRNTTNPLTCDNYLWVFQLNWTNTQLHAYRLVNFYHT